MGAVRKPADAPVASAPAAVSLAEALEYEIIVDQSNGEPLGVDVDHVELSAIPSSALLIQGLNNGLIQNWNRTHPAVQVLIGDTELART